MSRTRKIAMMVYVEPETRVLVQRLILKRMEAGRSPGESTQGAICEQALRLLAAQELPAAVTPTVDGVAGTPEPASGLSLAERSKYLTEYCGGEVPAHMVAVVERMILAKGEPLPYPGNQTAIQPKVTL